MTSKQIKPGLKPAGISSPAQQKGGPFTEEQMEALSDLMAKMLRDTEDRVIKTVTQTMNQRMDQGEKNMDKNLESLKRDVQEGLKTETENIKRLMEVNNEKVKQDILTAVTSLTKDISLVAQEVEVIKEASIDLAHKTTEIQENVSKVEDEGMIMQYRSMEFALRIRGLSEQREENLEERCAAVIADILGNYDMDVSANIDKIYRVNNWYARQKRLPRDVVIYFTTRKMRNMILQEAFKGQTKVNGEKIMVLKELPPKMLKIRKEFHFLTNELKRRELQFRWDVPAGVVLMYQGQRYRLNTLWKARDFLVRVLKVEVRSPHEKVERKSQQEKEEKAKELEELEGVSGGEDEVIFSDALQVVEDTRSSSPKDQRLTRAKVKEQKEKIQREEEKGAVGGTRPKEMSQKLLKAKNGN